MEIFRCRDIDNVVVVCYKDTWENHIAGEHLEVKGCEHIVKEAIEKPYRVYQDSRHISRKNIYKPFVLPKPCHTDYLRVGIEYRKRLLVGLRGFVRTAFACKNIRKGDILIWEDTKWK